MNGGSWIIELNRHAKEVSIIETIWVRLVEFLCFNKTPKCYKLQSQLQEKQKQHGQILLGGDELIDVTSILEHICGLKISMRLKSYQISVWTDNFVE